MGASLRLAFSSHGIGYNQCVSPVPRILVLYATAGAGHRRAAEAIAEQLRDRAVVAVQDIIGFTHPLFRTLYVGGGLGLITRWPRLYGVAYRVSDKPGFDRLIRKPRQRAQQLGAPRLEKAIRAFEPDVIVSTHFLSSELCAARRLTQRLTAPLITVITDFEPHHMWQHPGTDLYCAPSEAAAERLIDDGIDPNAIKVTGIPISAAFHLQPDRTTARDRIGLQPDRPMVLIMGGGLGVGAMEQVAQALQHQPLDAQLVFIAGNNRILRRKLKSLSSEWIVRGFVDNMPDWLAAAEGAISKAGGLAASELLAAGVPTIVPLHLTGHETANAEYFAATGAARIAPTADRAVSEMRQLLADPVQHQSMIDAAKRAAKPEAAADIAQLALALASADTHYSLAVTSYVEHSTLPAS